MKQIAYCRDSIEFLKQLPDNSIDLIIADPQQGNGTATAIAKKSGKISGELGIPKGTYRSSEWDLTPMSNEFFDQIMRVGKHQIIWCASFYLHLLRPGTQWICWRKLTGGNYGDVEMAWTSFQGAHREITFKWNGHQQAHSIKQGDKQGGNKAKNEQRIHPSQKPSKLYEWIYRTYAKSDWKILDPTMGSGSSRIAAYRLGLEYIGIEIDPGHFEDHLTWWKEEYRPEVLKLFDETPCIR